MSKFFVTPQEIHFNKVTIKGDEAAHISRVLRMKAGEEIQICDSQGTDFRGKILAVSEGGVELEILDSWSCENEPCIEVALFQGLPKGDKMDMIIQKSVELGVHSIVPVATEFAVAKISDKKSEEKKLARWNKISHEAAKQCGRGVLPEVLGVLDLKAAVEKAKEFDLVFVPYEKADSEGGASFKDLLSEFKLKKFDYKPKIAFFIGPEGGFSDKEMGLFLENGIKPISLGKRILRTETAGVVVLAMMMYELEL